MHAGYQVSLCNNYRRQLGSAQYSIKLKVVVFARDGWCQQLAAVYDIAWERDDVLQRLLAHDITRFADGGEQNDAVGATRPPHHLAEADGTWSAVKLHRDLSPIFLRRWCEAAPRETCRPYFFGGGGLLVVANIST
jgi:hypothetical protein